MSRWGCITPVTPKQPGHAHALRPCAGHTTAACVGEERIVFGDAVREERRSEKGRTRNQVGEEHAG